MKVCYKVTPAYDQNVTKLDNLILREIKWSGHWVGDVIANRYT